MGIANAINHRPVRVLGFVTAIHSIIYGIGYILATGGFTGTVLYVNFGSTFSTNVFGSVLIIVGTFLAFAYSRNNPKTIRGVSKVQSAVWAYATMTYLLNGAWMLALGISLPWVLISAYLAYAHGNREAIIAYDQTPEAKQDTLDEDKIDD